MIRWLNPAAFWAIALVAVPIAIHLLRTHRAKRHPFPALRFVQPSQTAAVRMRPPSDLALLATRLAIVAAAVCAAAQPLVLTARRLEAWNARTARAIVIDSTAAARSTAAASEADGAAEREAASAAFHRRIDAEDLRSGIGRAAAWLRTVPPARLELIVVSDFVSGTFDRGMLDAIPQGVGFRAIRVGRSPEIRMLEPQRLLAPAPGAVAEREVTLKGPETLVRGRTMSEDREGLRLSDKAADTLRRTVAAAGAAAPSAEQPITITFSDDTGPPVAGARAVGRSSPGWMRRTLLRAQLDDGLRAAAAEVTTMPLGEGSPWTVVTRGGSGQPVVRAAEADGRLVFEVAAPSTSFLAAATLRAALQARQGPWSHPEREVVPLPEERLAAWTRSPAAVERDAWRQVDDSDARWLWGMVLVLLGFEHWLRERGARTAVETVDAAA